MSPATRHSPASSNSKRSTRTVRFLREKWGTDSSKDALIQEQKSIARNMEKLEQHLKLREMKRAIFKAALAEGQPHETFTFDWVAEQRQRFGKKARVEAHKQLGNELIQACVWDIIWWTDDVVGVPELEAWYKEGRAHLQRTEPNAPPKINAC